MTDKDDKNMKIDYQKMKISYNNFNDNIKSCSQCDNPLGLEFYFDNSDQSVCYDCVAGELEYEEYNEFYSQVVLSLKLRIDEFLTVISEAEDQELIDEYQGYVHDMIICISMFDYACGEIQKY